MRVIAIAIIAAVVSFGTYGAHVAIQSVTHAVAVHAAKVGA